MNKKNSRDTSRQASPSRSQETRRGNESSSSSKRRESPTPRGRSSPNVKGKGDEDLPRKRAPSKKSASGIEKSIFTELPKVKDVAEDQKQELLCKKIELCKKISDFNSDLLSPEKEGKRQTLLELVEYVNTKDCVISEVVVKEALQMVSANLFRALLIKERSPFDVIDPDEDELYLDKAWPHLEVVYELLLRCVMCKELDAKVASKYLDQAFVTKLVALFESDDTRERDYVKMIMQRLYNKFINLRTSIRRAIQNALLKVAYEHEMQNGVEEMLAIMHSIIIGFKVPLKPEHRDLLKRVLLPLHKVRSLPDFQPTLLQCMTAFAEKDARLVSDIIAALLNLWPNSMAHKQVLFLDEIEEMLNITRSFDFSQVEHLLVRRLALCISSPHVQVAERGLAYWKNDTTIKLFHIHRKVVYPIVLRALYKNVRQQWHENVHARTFEVMKVLVETDHELFDACSAETRKIASEEELRDERRAAKWKYLQDMFDRRGGAEAAARAARVHRIATLPNGRETEVLCRRGALPLTKAKYGVSVSCAHGKTPPVELSVQAVVVNEAGTIIDAVYDYKPDAMLGSIYLSAEPSVESIIGLEASTEPLSGRSAGRKATLQGRNPDIVWVQLNRVPQHVKMVIFVVASCHRRHIRDAAEPKVSVLDEVDRTCVAQYEVAAKNSDVGAVAAFRRTSASTWSLIRVDEFSKTGRHFMDMIEPTLGNLVRSYFPQTPKRLKVVLPTRRGTILTMPSALTIRWLFVGIGWDLAPAAADGVNLEVGCVLVGGGSEEVAMISSPDSQEKVGVRHGGNGLLNVGMTFDLEQIPEKVTQIVFVGHVRSSEQTFVVVHNPHCRIVDRAGVELGRHDIREKSHKNGLVFGRIFREGGKKRWFFQAISVFTGGYSLQAVVEEARPSFEKTPQELQAHFEEELMTMSMDSNFTEPKRRLIVGL